MTAVAHRLSEFRAWLGTAPPPLGFAVSATQAAIASATGASWVVSLGDTKTIDQMLVTIRDEASRVWAPRAGQAAISLARRGAEPLSRLGWLHCASTAYAVTNPGLSHWTQTGSRSTDDGPRGAARTAVATARFMDELQRNTLNATRAAVLVAASQEQLWRPSVPRGRCVDVVALHAQLVEKEGERRAWARELGIDLLDTETDGGAAATHAWLGAAGITITDPKGRPSLSRDDFHRAVVPDTLVAAEAWSAFRSVRSLGSHLGKLRELRAFEKNGRTRSLVIPYAQRSGRTSVTRPALQNVAASARPLLTAEPGHVLVSLDYEQVEPRVAAALSGDPDLAHDLAMGDLYEGLAVRVRGDDAIGDDAARALFKRALLAILYGQGAPSLGRSLSVSTSEATAVIDSVWAAYPKLAAYVRDVKSQHTTGRLPLLASGRPVAQPKGGYAALNAIVQATAADILHAAVARVADALGPEALWLTVHDELIVQVADAEAEAAATVLNALMPTELAGIPITGRAVILGTHWRKA